LVNQEERKELCEELQEIESDLIRQLLRVYKRGANYEEFWELVERLQTFSQLRKGFCG
jgi:hypothetical protein